MSEQKIVVSPEFEAAAKEFADLVKESKPNNDEKLEGYALYKQGSAGDNTKAAPGLLTMPTEKAKWNAYEAKKGLAPEEAQTKYIAFVKETKTKYGS